MYDADNYHVLYKHVLDLCGQVWLASFPNLFITVSPAEWTGMARRVQQSFLPSLSELQDETSAASWKG